jgi:hypothetical protein
VYQPPPKRVLAKSGELRQEYEQELNKVKIMLWTVSHIKLHLLPKTMKQNWTFLVKVLCKTFAWNVLFFLQCMLVLM